MLQAGLNALKQSLRKVTALVVDLRPLQFNDWDLPNEPAEIATAKQEARESSSLCSTAGDLSRNAEFGGSGHCRIAAGDLEKLQPKAAVQNGDGALSTLYRYSVPLSVILGTAGR